MTQERTRVPAFRIELDADGVQLVLASLAAQPYARVATLIHDIQAQATRQVPAPAPSPTEEDR